jgi:poly-gamma-glutamate capsule biosynthesis protein CapA/YwtB (metallophosphatase superfamily)
MASDALPLTVALAGDVTPARPLTPVPESAEKVYALVGGADIAIGNLEMALTNESTPVHKLVTRRASPEIARDIYMLGFDVLSVANNHTVDYGWPGLRDTSAALAAGGVRAIGAGPTRREAAAPVIERVAGRRVGVIAFSCLTPAGMDAADERPGIASIRIDTAYQIDAAYQMEEPGDPSVVKIRTQARAGDLAFATEAVRRLRADCDLLIVSIHWGFGSGEILAEYQAPLGAALIDAGADIVHGHHPHAVHAIGAHRGKPILFGLGTFMAQQFFLNSGPAAATMRASMSPDGYIALVDIEPDDGLSVRIVPTTLDSHYAPTLACGAAFERIAVRLQRLSAAHGVSIDFSATEGRVLLPA